MNWELRKFTLSTYIQFKIAIKASTNNRLPFIGMEIIKTDLRLPKMANKGHF